MIGTGRDTVEDQKMEEDSDDLENYLEPAKLKATEEERKKIKERCGNLTSAIHKYVRRSMPLEAMMAAHDLYLLRPYQCMGELRTVSIEDVSQPLEIVCVDVLLRQITDMGRNEFLDGKNLLRVMDAAKILAEAKKDRRADELFNLTLPQYQTPQSQELLRRLRQLADYVYDKHTPKGRRMGRDTRHFVEEASVCKDKSPAYDDWREIWESIVNRGK